MLNDLRYHAVIVMDEPLLRGSFDPESKGSVYIEASDAFVSVCTEDPGARRPAGEAATATGTVRAGEHRSAGAADLLIAATAERERPVILCDLD
jgi:hypothetical protein